MGLIFWISVEIQYGNHKSMNDSLIEHLHQILFFKINFPLPFKARVTIYKALWKRIEILFPNVLCVIQELNIIIIIIISLPGWSFGTASPGCVQPRSPPSTATPRPPRPISCRSYSRCAWSWVPTRAGSTGPRTVRTWSCTSRISTCPSRISGAPVSSWPSFNRSVSKFLVLSEC